MATMTAKEYAKTWEDAQSQPKEGYGYKRQDCHFFKLCTADEKFVPTLSIWFSPPIVGHGGGIGTIYLGVNDCQQNFLQDNFQSNKNEWGPGKGQNTLNWFDVYDIDPEQLKDPTIKKPILINPEGVKLYVTLGRLTCFDEDAAKAGSRIVDPNVRKRINQYFPLPPSDVKHWADLRAAATNDKVVPGYGVVTYNYIKQGNALTNADGKYRPWCSNEDIKFLEDYIAYHSIDVPKNAPGYEK